MKSIRLIEIGRESSSKPNLVSFLRACGRLTFLLVALFLFLDLPVLATATGDGALDPTFSNFTGVSKLPLIYAQTDWTTSGTANGNSLIYGYFTSISIGGTPTSVNSLAKIYYNGSTTTIDSSFNFPINGEVRGAYLANSEDTHSDIIIWGSFSLLAPDSTTFYNLARLTWNTLAVPPAYAVDATFPHIFNQGGSVKCIAVLGAYLSNNVLVGGFNMKVNPAVGGDTTKAYHLICLNFNFSYFSTYSRALSRPGGCVTAFGIYGGNQPRILGTLPQADGSYHWWEALASDMVTLQKSLGTNPTSGVNYGPIDGPIFNQTPISTGGPIITMGLFKNAFGMALSGVAQLNSSLTGLDNTTNNFNANINSLGGANHSVDQIFITLGGQPILAGNFTSFNGTACGYITRLNYSSLAGYGTVDTTFNANAGAGADDRPFKLYQPTGSSYLQLLGAFKNYHSTARGGLATIDVDGNLQPNYTGVAANSSTPGTVYAMEWDNSGFIIAGDFTGVGGKWHRCLARLNWDGSVDPTFLHNVDGVVRCLRQHWNSSSASQMLVAGNFGAVDGVGCTSLARYNINYTQVPNNPPIPTYSLDYGFKPAVTRADGTLADLRMTDVDNHGKIMIGGEFSTINGTAKTAFARLQSNGSLDNFTFTPPAALSNIRVNAGGSLDDSGAYVIVGQATYSGTPRGFACHLTVMGDLDPNFAIGQSPVPNVALFDDEVKNGGGPRGSGPASYFYLCGKFTHVSDLQGFNIPRGHIAKFNNKGILDTTWAPTTTTNGPINAMDVENNGKILIGGAFTTYNTTPRNGVARLNADGSLDPSFDPGTGASGGPVYLVNWDAWQGLVFIGGSFTTYNGAGAPGFARIFAGPKSRPGIAPLLLLLLDN